MSLSLTMHLLLVDAAIFFLLPLWFFARAFWLGWRVRYESGLYKDAELKKHKGNWKYLFFSFIGALVPADFTVFMLRFQHRHHEDWALKTFHLFFAIPLILILILIRVKYTGLVSPSIHKKLVYASVALYPIVLVSGLILTQHVWGEIP